MYCKNILIVQRKGRRRNWMPKEKLKDILIRKRDELNREIVFGHKETKERILLKEWLQFVNVIIDICTERNRF